MSRSGAPGSVLGKRTGREGLDRDPDAQGTSKRRLVDSGHNPKADEQTSSESVSGVVFKVAGGKVESDASPVGKDNAPTNNSQADQREVTQTVENGADGPHKGGEHTLDVNEDIKLDGDHVEKPGHVVGGATASDRSSASLEPDAADLQLLRDRVLTGAQVTRHLEEQAVSSFGGTKKGKPRTPRTTSSTAGEPSPADSKASVSAKLLKSPATDSKAPAPVLESASLVPTATPVAPASAASQSKFTSNSTSAVPIFASSSATAESKFTTTATPVYTATSVYTDTPVYTYTPTSRRRAAKSAETKHTLTVEAAAALLDSCTKDEMMSVTVLPKGVRERNWEASHECMGCLRFFTSQDQFDAHMRLHRSTRKPFRCPVCSKNIAAGNLPQHLAEHDAVDLYLCALCDRPFADLHEMLVHLLLHRDPKGAHVCQPCGMLFASRVELDAHRMLHRKPGNTKTRRKAASNETGTKKIPGKGAKTQHKAASNETGNKNICQTCGNLFGSRVALDDHRKLHRKTGKAAKTQRKAASNVTGTKKPAPALRKPRVRRRVPVMSIPAVPTVVPTVVPPVSAVAPPPYTPVQMGKYPQMQMGQFSQMQMAQMQMGKYPQVQMGNYPQQMAKYPQIQMVNFPQMQMGVYPPAMAGMSSQNIRKVHSCSGCRLLFASESALGSHWQTCPYVIRCSACSLWFWDRYQWEHHMQTEHRTVKKHECPQCPGQYRSSKLLFNHWAITHPDDMSSLLEGHCVDPRVAKTSSALPKPGTLDCALCGVRCKSMQNLTRHFQLHAGGASISCEGCQQRFLRVCDLHRHLRAVHSGVPPAMFLCTVCPQSFDTEARLVAHLQAHNRIAGLAPPMSKSI